MDTVDTKTYEKFRSMLIDSIKFFIKEEVGPYYPSEFDDQTEIFIDTILFSPQKNRIAFFVITKNTNDRLLSGGSKEEYHYNANSFTGELEEDGTWTLNWLNAINFTGYRTYEKASQRIREAHFKLFNRRKGNDGKSLYKYNLNDKRFWEGPVWKSH